MFVACVTGTNGKTSVVHLAHQLLAASGRRVAAFSTLGVVNREGELIEDLAFEHPEDPMPQFLRLAREGSYDAVVVETVSRALAAGVHEAVEADCAVVTNVTIDHLDVHGSADAYVAAKLKLFEEVLVPGGTAVVNQLASVAEEVVDRVTARDGLVRTYGPSGDIQLLPAEAGHVAVAVGDQRWTGETTLPPGYPRENLLAAVGIVEAAGWLDESVLDHISEVRLPPGRLEEVAQFNGARVVVDYGHNPDGLQRALLDLRPTTSGRLIVVFGCGGDRDRGKRPTMGEVATTRADVVVVTDDNPRSEDPSAIRADILRGCPDAFEVPDRREAIWQAMEAARPGDVVLIAGRGHETTSEEAGEHTFLSDRATILAGVKAAAPLAFGH